MTTHETTPRPGMLTERSTPDQPQTQTTWVVVGVDGLAHDADALALGESLSATLGGRILLAHVTPPAPPGRGQLEYEALEQAAGREILARVAGQAEAAPDSELVSGAPAAKGLARVAQERHAEMLVLGSSHRGPVGRIVPGGVGSRLLAHAPCAVAVAPVDYASHRSNPIARIAVAYDTTPAADLALKAAAAAATQLDVPLILYHAMYPSPKGDVWDQFRGHLEEFADVVLDGGLKQLPAGVRATTRVLEGHVAEVVAEAASQDDVDLLYVGSRGYGPLREALVGGVCGGLLHTAGVPLVIVPARAAARGAGDG